MAGSDLDAVLTAISEITPPADTGPPSAPTSITATTSAATSTATMPAPVIADRMRQLVQARAMLDATLVEHLRAFDAVRGAEQVGQTSTRAWLRSRLRLGGAEAGQLLQSARYLDQVPQAAKALAAGEITLGHAAALAQLAGQLDPGSLTDYEQILLDLARQAPPGSLHTACAHVRQLLEPTTYEHDAARQRRARHLSAARTINGMVHLQGLLDPLSGDVVLTALQAAMPVPASYEERTPAQRRADALTDVCAGWLATDEPPANGGSRPQVQVTISLDSLRSDTRAASTLPVLSKWAPTQQAPTQQAPTDTASTDGASTDAVPVSDLPPGRPLAGNPLTGSPLPGSPLVGGPLPHRPLVGGPLPHRPLSGDVPVLADHTPIPVSEARRAACDAGIIPAVLGGAGEPLDIGRQSRLVPVGLRRALHLRDGGCRFPGCDRPPSWCDAHHIHAWADGGPTALPNLLLVCRYHHTLIHEGWRLTGSPDQTIQFHRPDGTRLDLPSRPHGQPLSRSP